MKYKTNKIHKLHYHQLNLNKQVHRIHQSPIKILRHLLHHSNILLIHNFSP